MVARLMGVKRGVRIDTFVMQWFKADTDAQEQAQSQLKHVRVPCLALSTPRYTAHASAAQLLTVGFVKKVTGMSSAEVSASSSRQGDCIQLGPDVRRHLAAHQESPGRVPLPSTVGSVDPGRVEAHARMAWNGILTYLLGSPGCAVPPPEVLVVLVSIGLLGSGGAEQAPAAAYARMVGISTAPSESTAGAHAAGDGQGDTAEALEQTLHRERETVMSRVMQNKAVHITRKGYAFLLQDLHVQLWSFVGEYIKSKARVSAALAAPEVLGLLFQLSFCEAGKAYDARGLSKASQLVLRDLAVVGLVLLTESGTVYPTSLCARLAGSQSKGEETSGSSVASPSSVVVEKNMRVYMYSSDPVQVSLLALCAEIDSVLPNLTCATLKRRSVVQALDMGLTATSIVGFLRSRLHGVMKEQGLDIPENVSDQLYAWEAERTRTTMTSCGLLRDFDSRAEFEEVLQKLMAAKSPCPVLFADEDEMLIVVHAHARALVKQILQAWRASRAGQA